MNTELDIILLLVESGGTLGIVLGVILLVLFRFGPSLLMFFMKRQMIHPGAIYRPDEILKAKFKYWKNIRLNSFKIDNPCKRMIIEDFFRIKLEVIGEQLEKIEALTQLPEFEEMAPLEIYGKLIDIINVACNEYKKRAINAGIPEIFIEKYMHWRKFYINFFSEAAEEICRCSIYDSNTERYYALCMFYTSIFESSIVNMEKTIINLNGDLDSVVYRGEPCKRN